MTKEAWRIADEVAAERLALVAGGYLPIPCEGKKPIGPEEGGRGWQNSNATAENVKQWRHLHPNAQNTGVLTRITPAVDIDVRDEEVATRLHEMVARFVPGGLVRYGQRPKRAILFKTSEPFQKMQTPVYESPNGQKHQVEILCNGQQILVFGAHPETGRTYEWEGDSPAGVKRDHLPELTAATAHQIIAAAAVIMERQGWKRTGKVIDNSHPELPMAQAESGPNETTYDELYGERMRKYAAAALRGCADELKVAPEGARNDTLNKSAFRLGTMIARGWIARDGVAAKLLIAAKECGLDEAEACRTLKSGLDAGENRPHPDLTDRSSQTSGNEVWCNEQQGPSKTTVQAQSVKLESNGAATGGGNGNGAEKTPWPDPVHEAAYYGLAGEVVRAIEPHTEADKIALLLQFLAFFGNVVGRRPYYQVEGDKHFPNMFAVLVGETSKARKGTSAGRIRQVFEQADPMWVKERIHSGMSSGEGLIWNVRDPAKQWKKTEGGEGAEKEVDPGITDKRLMIIEPEFAGTLSVMKREGSTLSRVVRDAWDRGDLATLTKHAPASATGAHISIVGHITAFELRRSLDRVSMANGYANRFLVACVRRGRILPHGGDLSEKTIRELGMRVQTAMECAERIDQVVMTDEARKGWENVYPALSDGRPGLLGAIVGRAEAQVIRLAMLYALLDGKADIDMNHLAAALALWGYCERSAYFIFGDMLGDPDADEILRALRRNGDAGMTRTEISGLFGRHRSSSQIEASLAALAGSGKARSNTRDTGGRPVEVWAAI
jgi:hypothetical protein